MTEENKKISKEKQVHKYLESEKAGKDMGRRATDDYLVNHLPKYIASNPLKGTE